jgi:hypothetical protein
MRVNDASLPTTPPPCMPLVPNKPLPPPALPSLKPKDPPSEPRMSPNMLVMKLDRYF